MTSDLAPLLRYVLFIGEAADRGTPTVAPASNFTRNNRSNTSRWATNAGSRTARRHGDARNTHGHGHARISTHDALVRHSHVR